MAKRKSKSGDSIPFTVSPIDQELRDKIKASGISLEELRKQAEADSKADTQYGRMIGTPITWPPEKRAHAVAFDAALCESFPVTSDQIEILKAIDEAGGRLKSATINSSESKRKAAEELRTNRFLTHSKATFEMTANGRAVLESHRIWQQELEHTRLMMSVDDHFAGKRTKPVTDQTPADAKPEFTGDWQHVYEFLWREGIQSIKKSAELHPLFERYQTEFSQVMTGSKSQKRRKYTMPKNTDAKSIRQGYLIQLERSGF